MKVKDLIKTLEQFDGELTILTGGTQNGFMKNVDSENIYEANFFTPEWHDEESQKENGGKFILSLIADENGELRAGSFKAVFVGG